MVKQSGAPPLIRTEAKLHSRSMAKEEDRRTSHSPSLRSCTLCACIHVSHARTHRQHICPQLSVRIPSFLLVRPWLSRIVLQGLQRQVVHVHPHLATPVGLVTGRVVLLVQGGRRSKGPAICVAVTNVSVRTAVLCSLNVERTVRPGRGLHSDGERLLRFAKSHLISLPETNECSVPYVFRPLAKKAYPSQRPKRMQRQVVHVHPHLPTLTALTNASKHTRPCYLPAQGEGQPPPRG